MDFVPMRKKYARAGACFAFFTKGEAILRVGME